MATTYPGVKQTFTNPAGTQTQDSPDHAGLHTTAQDTIAALEDTVGTTAGTNVLKSFAAGDFAARINASNVLQQSITGTFNNTTFGTPTIAGTWAAPAGLVVTADLKDANVTGRKMKIDQFLGTFVTVGTLTSASFTAIVSGTLTPNVTSNILVIVNTHVLGNSATSEWSFQIQYNGTAQTPGTICKGAEPQGAVGNIEYGASGAVWIQNAPASAGTITLLGANISAGSTVIKSVGFNAFPFAA